MKTLYLLRHAKSSWDDARLSDYERPLNKRGRSAAPLVGDAMRRRRIAPELIVSSPAVRARETTEAAAKAANLRAAIKYDRRIYEADPPTLLQIVAEQNDRAHSLLLVGHNPGFENLLALLTGAAERMPTAALAIIEINAEKWREIAVRKASLRALWRPKETFGSLTKEF